MHRKSVIALLAIALLLGSPLSANAAQLHPQPPEDAVIRQVMAATSADIGWNAPVEYFLREDGSSTYRLDILHSSGYSSGITLVVLHSPAEAENAVREIQGLPGVSSFVFHGNPAYRSQSAGLELAGFAADRYHIEIRSMENKAEYFLETFYQHAVANGLIAGESGKTLPTATEPPAPTQTPTQQTGNPIVLQASLNGQGGNTQSVPNANNLATLTISGVVVDQDGKGIAGAVVEILSGAGAASVTTAPDGSYTLTANVPGGQGQGTAQGVNFTLQAGDLSIQRVVLLQAIEGGQLVTYRDVGVRVFLNWGLDKDL